MIHRRASRRRPGRLRAGRLRLHIYTFTDLASPHRTELAISIRSRLDSMACFGEAARSARERLPGAALTDMRSVPAPWATPHLDALCRKHTGFGSFLALLTAASGYLPSIRLDLTGAEGRALARAYDAWQARWGDPRRACVWPTP